MVRRIIKSIKSVLFADPNLLLEEERKLVNKPFYFQGTNGKGIILIHGWTTTAYEVRRLGKYLNEEGFTVSGPMLRGHGTKPQDLEGVKWSDWLNDLSQEFDRLKKECDKVYLGGTSLGGVLALLLAKERPQTAGLILMATPYAVKFEKIIFSYAKFLSFFKRYSRKYYPPTFGISTTITRLISYQKYPLKSVFESYAMIQEARRLLGEIHQPCFLIKSKQDHIITRNSLEKIYAKIGSEVKKKKYINRAYHTFISDIKNEKIFEDISQFLKEN
jgi:carboxylesterase